MTGAKERELTVPGRLLETQFTCEQKAVFEALDFVSAFDEIGGVPRQAPDQPRLLELFASTRNPDQPSLTAITDYTGPLYLPQFRVTGPVTVTVMPHFVYIRNGLARTITHLRPVTDQAVESHSTIVRSERVRSWLFCHALDCYGMLSPELKLHWVKYCHGEFEPVRVRDAWFEFSTLSSDEDNDRVTIDLHTPDRVDSGLRAFTYSASTVESWPENWSENPMTLLQELHHLLVGSRQVTSTRNPYKCSTCPYRESCPDPAEAESRQN